MIQRTREDISTGNLSRHASKCSGHRTKASRVMEQFTQSSTYSPSRLRYMLNLWIVRRHRPFSIVEDAELIEIFQMFCGHVVIPSARTISRDIQEIFQMTKENVARFLQVSSTFITINKPLSLKSYSLIQERFILGWMAGHLQILYHIWGSWFI